MRVADINQWENIFKVFCLCSCVLLKEWRPKSTRKLGIPDPPPRPLLSLIGKKIIFFSFLCLQCPLFLLLFDDCLFAVTTRSTFFLPRPIIFFSKQYAQLDHILLLSLAPSLRAQSGVRLSSPSSGEPFYPVFLPQKKFTS